MLSTREGGPHANRPERGRLHCPAEGRAMLSAGSTLETASRTGNRTHSLAIPRLALWAILGAKLLAAWGVMWDIQWHVRIGRDSFWIPPHTMTYAGVSLVVMLSFGMLDWYTALGAEGRGIVRVLGIRGA